MSKHSGTSSHLLIDGTFSCEEARTILMALIADKIQFHHQDNWSRKERFGEFDEDSSRRIEQLNQTREDLAALIDDAGASGEQLVINCSIEITRIAKK
jgi:hypothetical protein